MKHQWGCNCAECANRGRKALAEAQAVRDHNRQALYSRAYQRTAGPHGEHCAMYYRFDWMTQPKPGELEYLRGAT
jgi:hypothetical protein